MLSCCFDMKAWHTQKQEVCCIYFTWQGDQLFMLIKLLLTTLLPQQPRRREVDPPAITEISCLDEESIVWPRRICRARLAPRSRGVETVAAVWRPRPCLQSSTISTLVSSIAQFFKRCKMSQEICVFSISKYWHLLHYQITQKASFESAIRNTHKKLLIRACECFYLQCTSIVLLQIQLATPS